MEPQPAIAAEKIPKPEPKQAMEKAGTFPSGMLGEILAYSSAAVGTMLSMWAFARKYSHDTFKKTPLFQQVGTQTRDKDFSLLTEASPDFIEKMVKAEKNYGKEIGEIYKKLGVTTWDKMRLMSKYELARVGGLGIAVFGITVGAILNTRKNMQLQQEIDKLNRKVDSGVSAER